MPLDPRAERFLRMLSSVAEPGAAPSLQNRRDSLANLADMAGADPDDAVEVDQLMIATNDGPLTARRYRAPGYGPSGLLFIHGGGWVAGGLGTHHGVCLALARFSECQVFALDYRLAPEHPFPAALQDVLAAAAWLGTETASLGLDRTLLAIAGDSAGGNLAAAATLELRDRGEQAFAVQLLICPILDLSFEHPSRLSFAEGFFLSRSAFLQDLGDYVPEGVDRRQPRLSPLNGDLSGLPPTLIHVAEFDPFRDEGLAYAERLKAAGSRAEVVQHNGMIHYFYAIPKAVPYATQALEGVGRELRAALSV